MKLLFSLLSVNEFIRKHHSQITYQITIGLFLCKASTPLDPSKNLDYTAKVQDDFVFNNTKLCLKIIYTQEKKNTIYRERILALF